MSYEQGDAHLVHMARSWVSGGTEVVMKPFCRVKWTINRLPKGAATVLSPQNSMKSVARFRWPWSLSCAECGISRNNTYHYQCTFEFLLTVVPDEWSCLSNVIQLNQKTEDDKACSVAARTAAKQAYDVRMCISLIELADLRYKGQLNCLHPVSHHGSRVVQTE